MWLSLSKVIQVEWFTNNVSDWWSHCVRTNCSLSGLQVGFHCLNYLIHHHFETIIITIIVWWFTSSHKRYCGNGNYQMCVPHHVYGFHQVAAYADKKYIVDKEMNKNSLTLDAKYIDRSLLVLWLPTSSIHLMPWYTRWALTSHQFESPQMEINAWIDV